MPHGWDERGPTPAHGDRSAGQAGSPSPIDHEQVPPAPRPAQRAVPAEGGEHAFDVAEHALGRPGRGERRRRVAEVLLELVGCPDLHGASSIGERPGSGAGTTVRAPPSTRGRAVHSRRPPLDDGVAQLTAARHARGGTTEG